MKLERVDLPKNIPWLGRVRKNNLIRINKASARASWHRVKHVYTDPKGLYYIQVKNFGPDYVRFNPMPVLEKLVDGSFRERFVLVENCPFLMCIVKKESYQYVPERSISKIFQKKRI